MPTRYDGQPSSLPNKPEIPDALLDIQEGVLNNEYKGIIKEGMVFAWEPYLPYARELIVVAKIDNLKVATYSFPAGPNGYENMRLNDVSRFREAVMPTVYNKFLKPMLEPMKDSIMKERLLNMQQLADEVAEVWTDLQYPDEFNTQPQPHRHFTHALMHIMKACGKLAEVVDAADHFHEWRYGKALTEKALADIIISTQRMAEKADVNLTQAVTARLVTLRGRYLKKEPEDNSWYDASARILFEEIHGDESWDKLTREAQYNWREVARKHFLRTTHANVARAEKADPKSLRNQVDQYGGEDLSTIGTLVPRRD